MTPTPALTLYYFFKLSGAHLKLPHLCLTVEVTEMLSQTTSPRQLG